MEQKKHLKLSDKLLAQSIQSRENEEAFLLRVEARTEQKHGHEYMLQLREWGSSDPDAIPDFWHARWLHRQYEQALVSEQAQELQRLSLPGDLRLVLEERLQDLISRGRGPFKSDIFSVAQVQNYMDKSAGPLNPTELQYIMAYMREHSQPLPQKQTRIPHYDPSKAKRRICLRSLWNHDVWSKADESTILKEFGKYGGACKAPYTHDANRSLPNTSNMSGEPDTIDWQAAKPRIGAPEYREYISEKYRREQKRRHDAPRVQSELREAKLKRLHQKAAQRRSDEVEALQEVQQYREDARAQAVKWDDGTGPRNKRGYVELQREKRRTARVATYKPVIRDLLEAAG